MNAETLTALTAVLAVVIALYAAWKAQKPVTLASAQEFFTEAQTLAGELNEVAQQAVRATEQLKETGRINSNDEALQHALDHITRWFPGLDRQIALNAAEAAYFGLKLLMEQQATVQIDQAESVTITEDRTP